MRLKVKSTDGKLIQIFLNEFDTCEHLKLKIEKGLGIQSENQKLIFDKTVLNVNNILLQNYGIIDGSIIDVFLYTKNAPMDVGLKTKNGKEVTINVMKKDKIIEVKRYIQNKLEIFPNQQMLLYGERFLDDLQTLSAYHINDTSKLTMIERFQHPIEVTIRSDFNLLLKFTLYPNEDVLTLKKYIYKFSKIKVYHQKLFYDGNLLKDEKTLDKYDITEDVDIYLTITSKVTTFLKKLQPQQSTINTKKKFKSQKIVEIRREFLNRENLPSEEYKSFYNGKLLSDHKTAAEYNLNKTSNFKYVKAEIKLSIKSPDNEIIEIFAMKNETIMDIKWIINEKTGVDPYWQRLMYNNETLSDEKTLNDYKIEIEAIININTLKMQLIVQLNGGKTFNLYVMKTDRIIVAKRQIKELTGIPPEEQVFIFKYGFLKSERTMNDYLITDRSILDVITKLKSHIKVFAKTIDEMQYSIEIIENEKVSILKQKIEEATKISVLDQTLIYQGYQLDDEKTVNEYGIVKYSVISVSDVTKKITKETL